MQNVKSKLEQEQNSIKSLEASKALLEQEIAALQNEKKQFEEELKNLKESILKLLKDEKVDLIPKLERYYGREELYYNARVKVEETRTAILETLEQLRHFLKNQPQDPKKALKPKLVEKLDTQLALLLTKINAEMKKRKIITQKDDDVRADLLAFKMLLN